MDLENVQFASRFENQAHVRRRKVPFFGGGGGRKLEFFTCLFLTFFFLVAFRFLVLYLCAYEC